MKPRDPVDCAYSQAFVTHVAFGAGAVQASSLSSGSSKSGRRGAEATADNFASCMMYLHSSMNVGLRLQVSQLEGS